MKQTIRQRLAELVSRKRDRLIAAAKMATVAFSVHFLPSLLGWWSEVSSWADAGATGDFPSVSPLAKAVTSGAVAAAAGLGSLVVNALQARGWLPGRPPSYDRKQ